MRVARSLSLNTTKEQDKRILEKLDNVENMARYIKQLVLNDINKGETYLNGHKGYVERSSHGMRNTRIYRIWTQMKQRCNNPNTHLFEHYGGRGIKYAPNWDRFEGFRDDMYESYMEHEAIHGSKNTTLERIDVNKGYTKDNCKWATWIEQSKNRRTLKR